LIPLSFEGFAESNLGLFRERLALQPLVGEFLLELLEVLVQSSHMLIHHVVPSSEINEARTYQEEKCSERLIGNLDLLLAESHRLGEL